MIPIGKVIGRWSFANAFPKRKIIERGPSGHSFPRWLRCGMPLIPPEIMSCCFFLYKDVKDAKKGRPFGGTGFFIGVRSKVDETEFHLFGVTNWHVAIRDGFSVIRVNNLSGGVEIIETEPTEWIWRPGWHDLAIIGLAKSDDRDYTPIDSNMLLTKKYTEQLGVAPGTDVFMIGRFVDHDGQSTNVPSVRFGHVSVMPIPGIKQPTGATLESYVLDVHARTGYSGSPVFAYRTLGSDLRTTSLVTGPGALFLQLAGVLWGQFPEKWRLTATGKVKPSSNPRRFIGQAEIDGMSGMTTAVPSWALLELLDEPITKKFIMEQEDILRAHLQRNGDDLPPQGM
jgi:hypothetical protein